ncbi:DeoR/GlpR family DNA-binding transcription regulator [Actinomadura verrucosospora]|uniref:DeoR family transcriptional regulator n=1 Tax=Actinomadura verrucosospora TaxID=46165 RepID=A0A7D3VXY1_ACTVE|nr:DeoR/GlpR family DNA-binding transcription regulator [Actinomadura verrucosospora]QKG26100.1 DeoR family transcriptional regulator [Actinomadura verrucosospora]
MKAEERREHIARLLREQPVRVEEMAEAFAVSPSTIRRDLQVLSDEGAVVRTYGGALSAAPGEQPLHERERLALAQKAAIAEAAEARVRPGAMLLLDAGTTVGALASRLASWTGITVVTNGLTALDALADSAGVELVALGGAVRHVSLGMIGPLAEGALRAITVDTVFLGADGVVAGRGVCEGTAEQASLKRLMVEQAREVCVLADASKLGRAESNWWTPLDRPWTLITDSGATEEQLAPFRARREVAVTVAVP